MEKAFENFIIYKDENPENHKPFMLACKDREAHTEERWVISCLSMDEAKQLYEYLGKYIN